MLHDDTLNLRLFCPLTIYLHLTCRKIAPIFEKLSKNHATVTFVKIDIDEFPDIAGAFRVRSVPTFFFLNGDKVTSEVSFSCIILLLF